MADLTEHRSGSLLGNEYQVEAAIAHEEELKKLRQVKIGRDFVTAHKDPDEHEITYTEEDGWTCLKCRVTVGKNAIVDEEFINAYINVKIEHLLEFWSDLGEIAFRSICDVSTLAESIATTCRSPKYKNYSEEYIKKLAREFTTPF